MEYIKLKDVYYKAYRRNGLCFTVNGQNYTNHIINVTFKYSYKLYNMIGKNIYVYHEYNYKPSDMEDCIYIKDGKVMAVKVGECVSVNRLEHSEYFEFKNNAYHVKKNPPVLMSRTGLRGYLYEFGFKCNGIQFVRWKRSSGASRVGKCLFIDKRLYNRMHRWELCGLKIRRGQKLDLAAFESYIALTCSAIIGLVTIQPDEILVIDDYISRFKEEVAAVELDANNRLTANPKEILIENSIWDGQSLLDSSLFRNAYRKKGMLVLRNRFFKTCGFNTNIGQWFKDNNITDVSQLSGRTLAEDISKIKMITTPSSIKYLKFGSLEKWLENLEPEFGVVKYEKPPYYFKGKMVQGHYQLLNTLKFSLTEMEDFLKPSLDYIKLIENNPAVLRFHIGYQAQSPESISYISNNDLVYMMLGVNDDFARTRYYSEFRKTLVRSLVKNLKRGHVLVNGNYSTMFGNGLEMLQAAVGLFDGRSVIGVGNVISSRFRERERLLYSRSPHITMGNTCLANNISNTVYNRYFNLTNEIICVNSINENLMQRLNGADYDSDAVLITNDSVLVRKASELEDKFLAPVNLVPAQKIKRYYTSKHKADLDAKTSINKIGEIVNLSQELNSRYWHNGKFDSALYYDICKLAVLSGLEIDSAKVEVPVNSTYEINALKKKYSSDRKPYFFKMITIENGYKLNRKYHYEYFETSMDYLQKIINRFEHRRRPQNGYEPFYMMLKPFDLKLTGFSYDKRRDVINVIRNYNRDLADLYKKRHYIYAGRMKRECIDYIGALSLSKETVYLLVKLLDNKEYRDIRGMLTEVLFKTNNEAFVSLIQESVRPISAIKEFINGNIEIYGKRYLL